MTCPKCSSTLTTCLCCGAATLCRKCKACFGYKGTFRLPPAPVKALTGIVETTRRTQ